jgi:hypothetical protein
MHPEEAHFWMLEDRRTLLPYRSMYNVVPVSLTSNPISIDASNRDGKAQDLSEDSGEGAWLFTYLNQNDHQNRLNYQCGSYYQSDSVVLNHEELARELNKLRMSPYQVSLSVAGVV